MSVNNMLNRRISFATSVKNTVKEVVVEITWTKREQNNGCRDRATESVKKDIDSTDRATEMIENNIGFTSKEAEHIGKPLVSLYN